MVVLEKSQKNELKSAEYILPTINVCTQFYSSLVDLVDVEIYHCIDDSTLTCMWH